MKILFLGDIVAESGLRAVHDKIGFLKDKYKIDFTIANGENSANGKGITRAIYDNLIDMGVDVITLGNHAFSRKDIMPKLKYCPFLVRPVNAEPMHAGRSFVVKECNGKKIGVINILGSAFMNGTSGDPILAASRTLNKMDADIILIDFHAEATSEKMVFFEYFKNNCAAVIGTHTHVQTADEKVEDGCAFICDAGMCGAYDSILGRSKDEIINHIVYGRTTKYAPADGPYVVCGVVIDIDDLTCRANSIERFQIRPS